MACWKVGIVIAVTSCIPTSLAKRCKLNVLLHYHVLHKISCDMFAFVTFGGVSKQTKQLCHLANNANHVRPRNFMSLLKAAKFQTILIAH